jgi:hypothetical protein
MKTNKPKKFKTKTQKREWLSSLLVRLSNEVRDGKYGSDGCGANGEGYCIADVVDDAMDGFEPNKDDASAALGDSACGSLEVNG